jgi:response regulator RpfG family c-di-GMP phosphodiesterase
VIFLTSYSDRETLSRARVSEPYGYLLKPFDEQLLAITIEMAIYKHRMERERERLRRDLEASQQEIRTLSGLLPICCHCKKIRNDKGYWEQIDSYISRHSIAQFSHGICLDCFSSRHPEILEKILSDLPGGGDGI